jgi:hypothetical protein
MSDDWLDSPLPLFHHLMPLARWCVDKDARAYRMRRDRHGPGHVVYCTTLATRLHFCLAVVFLARNNVGATDTATPRASCW